MRKQDMKVGEEYAIVLSGRTGKSGRIPAGARRARFLGFDQDVFVRKLDLRQGVISWEKKSHRPSPLAFQMLANDTGQETMELRVTLREREGGENDVYGRRFEQVEVEAPFGDTRKAIRSAESARVVVAPWDEYVRLLAEQEQRDRSERDRKVREREAEAATLERAAAYLVGLGVPREVVSTTQAWYGGGGDRITITISALVEHGLIERVEP